MTHIGVFVSGAISALALVATLVFLRFFRQSRDRFFLYFALAFALHALARAAAALRLTGATTSCPICQGCWPTC